MSERKRRREVLTKDELKNLKSFVASFAAVVHAAEEIGIHRNVLDLVLIKGSGSPETIGLIKEKLDAVSKGAA
jgi:hypothetical protein